MNRYGDSDVPPPLTARQLARRRAIPPETPPPRRILTRHSSFRLPRGAGTPSLRRDGDRYVLEIDQSGRSAGPSIPYDKIPAERPQIKRIPKDRVQHRMEGYRPPHVPVEFLPARVPLRLRERARPPFDFDPKRARRDRPLCVVPPDDRKIYKDFGFPWRTVGRVETPVGIGSGCTIGPRHLLTAAHAIQWLDGQTTGWVVFSPAYHRGPGPYGTAYAIRVLYWLRNIQAKGISQYEEAFDYVVCVLDWRIGDVVGYPGATTYDASWNGGDFWQTMGYPNDLAGTERPSFQDKAVIVNQHKETSKGQTGLRLDHLMDATPGQSGGTVWGWFGDEPWPRVVAVQSAEANCPITSDTQFNIAGGGPALTALIVHARNKYP
jgi:V8-like Glu-specific endopeptidase